MVSNHGVARIMDVVRINGVLIVKVFKDISMDDCRAFESTRVAIMSIVKDDEEEADMNV